tara:strand:- start:329 stop:637 length:309 start_codon:yes stop_codon:yes gene_type:complete
MNYDNYNQLQFHHIQLERNKHGGALMRDDSNGVVLCFNCHHKIHTKYGEKKFWEMLNVDPRIKAKQMYVEYKEIYNEKRKITKRKNIRPPFTRKKSNTTTGN